VTSVFCEIALSKGRWGYRPSRSRARRHLRRTFGNRLLDVICHAPGDNAIEMDIRVDGDEDNCEEVRDAIFRAFLEWKPEYESMIEVSVAVD
jgi:hypothetical protein